MSAQAYRDALRASHPMNPRVGIGPGSGTGPRPSRYASKEFVPLLMSRYQTEQAALGRQVTQVIRNLWDQQIDPEQFSDSWLGFKPLMKLIIEQHYNASAASAAKFYGSLHVAEGLGNISMRLPSADLARLDRVSGAVASGTFYHQLNKQQREPGDASLIARNTMSGAGSRFALMGGRDTVIGTVRRDPQAEGWERILSSADACSFCTMYAAKGPFFPGFKDFHPHDYCHCVAGPLFRGHSSANAELKDTWTKVAQGRVGAEARTAWEEYRRQSSGNDTGARDNGGPGTASQAGQSATEQE